MHFEVIQSVRAESIPLLVHIPHSSTNIPWNERGAKEGRETLPTDPEARTESCRIRPKPGLLCSARCASSPCPTEPVQRAVTHKFSEGSSKTRRVKKGREAYGCVAGDPPLSLDDRRDVIRRHFEGPGQDTGVNGWI